MAIDSTDNSRAKDAPAPEVHAAQGDLSRALWSAADSLKGGTAGGGKDAVKKIGDAAASVVEHASTDLPGQLNFGFDSLYKSVHDQAPAAFKAVENIAGAASAGAPFLSKNVLKDAAALAPVLPGMAPEQAFQQIGKVVNQIEQSLLKGTGPIDLSDPFGLKKSGQPAHHNGGHDGKPQDKPTKHHDQKPGDHQQPGDSHPKSGAGLSQAGGDKHDTKAKGKDADHKPGDVKPGSDTPAPAGKDGAAAPVDKQKIDKLAESLHKESGADGLVKSLSHTDRNKVNELLKGTTEAERKELMDSYQKKYGHSLDKEYDFLSGSDKTKFEAALHKKDGDVGGQAADRVKAALQESTEMTGRSKDACAQDIRDTLSTMNSKQIDEARKSWNEKYNKDGKGTDFDHAILNSDLKQPTKEAAEVYLKGIDKRTDADTLKLANTALKEKDLTMFQESMRNASPSAREQFQKDGGDEKMKKAFEGHWYNVGAIGDSKSSVTDKQLDRARDYAKYGKESVAHQIKDNTGTVTVNDEGIKNALNSMTDKERQDYMRGKELAGKNVQPSDAKDKQALAYYKETHDALDKVHTVTHDSDMAAWEDRIATKGGGVISKIGEHRGSIYNDGPSAVTRDIENMDKGEWERLHNLKNGKCADGSEPKTAAEKQHNLDLYKQHHEELNKSLDGLKGGRIDDADVKNMKAMFDKKMDSKNFEESEKVRRPLMQALKDDTHWYGNDRVGMLKSIANMTPEEQKAYQQGGAFKTAVDAEVRDRTGVFKAGPGRDGAIHMLDNVAAGRPPEDALAKMYIRTQENLEHQAKKNGAASLLSIPTFGASGLINAGDNLAGNRGEAALMGSQSADAVRDLQEAFKKDPTLRDRILHDKEFGEKFTEVTKSAMTPADFEKYGKPLIETGHLSLEQKMEMNSGLVSNNREGAVKDLLSATPEEKQRLLSDGAYQEKVLGALSKDDRQIALNALKQGHMAPEDDIRSHLVHVGGSDEIMSTLNKIPPDQLEHVRHEYNQKYGSDLESDLIDKLGSDKRAEMEQKFRKHATSTEAYNDARDDYYKTRDGIGSKVFVDGFSSGTGHQLDNTMQQYGRELAEAHKSGKELSQERVRQLNEQFESNIKNFRESKAAAAEYAVDAAVMAAAVGGTVYTGGASLALAGKLAAVGAVTKVAGKAAIMGSDYDFSGSQVALDATSGAVSGATAVLGPGEVAGAFRVGEGAAGAAAKSALKELALKEVGEIAAKDAVKGAAETVAKDAAAAGAKEALNKGGKELVETEAKTLMKDALAHGAKEIDEKAVRAIAEKAISKELAGEVRQQAVKELAGSLKQKLTEGLEHETSSWFKNVLRQGALNGAAGGAGGGLSGIAEGVSRWDGSKSFDQNMKALGETVGMSALSGAGGAVAMTAGFKLGGKALGAFKEGLASHAPEGLHGGQDAPVVKGIPGDPHAVGKTKVSEVAVPAEAGRARDPHAVGKTLVSERDALPGAARAHAGSDAHAVAKTKVSEGVNPEAGRAHGPQDAHAATKTKVSEIGRDQPFEALSTSRVDETMRGLETDKAVLDRFEVPEDLRELMDARAQRSKLYDQAVVHDFAKGASEVMDKWPDASALYQKFELQHAALQRSIQEVDAQVRKPLRAVLNDMGGAFKKINVEGSNDEVLAMLKSPEFKSALASEKIKSQFPDMPSIQKQLEMVNELNSIRDAHALTSKEVTAVSKARVADLQAYYDGIADKHKLPRIALELSQEYGRHGEYKPGKGRLLLQEASVLQGTDRARLMNTMMHEFVHNEQDGLMVRAAAEIAGKGTDATGATVAKPSIEAIQETYRSMSGGRVPSRDYVENVLRQNPEALSERELARAKDLFHGSANYTSVPAGLKDDLRVAVGELNKLNSDAAGVPSLLGRLNDDPGNLSKHLFGTEQPPAQIREYMDLVKAGRTSELPADARTKLYQAIHERFESNVQKRNEIRLRYMENPLEQEAIRIGCRAESAATAVLKADKEMAAAHIWEREDGKRLFFDEKDRLTQLVDHNNNIFNYEYDAKGELSHVVGPHGVLLNPDDAKHLLDYVPGRVVDPTVIDEPFMDDTGV
ncbi:MAG TPA: hypothetical protein V6C97_10085 [Oculatellaceae cyanobacterium]